MTLTPFELATAKAMLFSENLVQASMLHLAAEPGPTPEDKERGQRFLETALLGGMCHPVNLPVEVGAE
tara:strand:- start:392 stop:595 length:204 start_codon:yes stop_codon:yes gene_type:complete